MSGRPTHAADVCSPEEIAAAAEASVYYGLAGLGNVIRHLPDEEAELDVDEVYHRLVPHAKRAFADRPFTPMIGHVPTSRRHFVRVSSAEHGWPYCGAS